MSSFVPSFAVARISEKSQRRSGLPGPGVVSLALGEPDFDTPAPVLEAGIAALRAGYTHYIDSSGDPELREALAETVSKIAGERFGADQLFVTHGAAAGITSAILSVCNPGDRIVIPSPNYPLYSEAAYMAGAVPVFVPTRPDYHLELDRLEDALKGARMLIICNPCNPTGAVFTREELNRVAELAQRNNVIVLADEAYSEIVYDGREFCSMLSLRSLRSQMIFCQTFSKTFAMTGWRVGYLAGPVDIIKAIGFINRTFVGGPNAAVNRAALEATRIGTKLAEPMREEYAKRRTLVMEHARRIEGLEARPPEGTFYLFARYDLEMPSRELVARLLQAGVAVRAGSEYGPSGEGHLRFSFATSAENIIEGLGRARKAFAALE